MYVPAYKVPRRNKLFYNLLRVTSKYLFIINCSHMYFNKEPVLVLVKWDQRGNKKIN